MKVTRQNNKYILEPDSEESITLDFLHAQFGSTYLERHIAAFIKQRHAQRDYDELQELHREILQLDESNKVEIRNDIKAAIAKAKLKPKKIVIDN